MQTDNKEKLPERVVFLMYTITMENMTIKHAYKVSLYLVIVSAVSIVAPHVCEVLGGRLTIGGDVVPLGSGELFGYLNNLGILLSVPLPIILIFLAVVFRFIPKLTPGKWLDIFFIICSVSAIISLPHTHPQGYVLSLGEPVPLIVGFRYVIIDALAIISFVISLKYLIENNTTGGELER